MTARVNRQWRLAARPVGDIKDSDFAWREEPVPALADGQLLVRTVYLSLDPTNRIWMSEQDQYMDPIALGDVMRGAAVGVVEESRHPGFAAGDLVSGLLGWQDYCVTDGAGLQKMPPGLPVPLTAFMGVLNHIGMTAYFGLLEIGKPQPGETIVVSAAAGAVGSLVGQIGKIVGCRVVGICGSDDKCAWLTDELGFDAAINRRTADLPAALREHCPDKIHVDFENAGGEILEAVLDRLALHARIVLCGLISQYNADGPVPGPSNLGNILMKRARLQGFIITDYLDRSMEAIFPLAAWLAEGKLRYRVDVAEGLENTPATLRRLYSGDNVGKLCVKVSEEPG